MLQKELEACPWVSAARERQEVVTRSVIWGQKVLKRKMNTTTGSQAELSGSICGSQTGSREGLVSDWEVQQHVDPIAPTGLTKQPGMRDTHLPFSTHLPGGWAREQEQRRGSGAKPGLTKSHDGCRFPIQRARGTATQG